MLLVRRGKAPSRGLYAFPGGRVEPGETHEAAARRELMEETGLSAPRLTPYRTMLIPGRTADYQLELFTACHAGGEPVADDDADAAGFFSLVEMQRMKVTETVLAAAREILAEDTNSAKSDPCGSPPCR